ncbi:unnamed protein product [Dovyalis caffra]|uniref:Uncharacterized protein n=1 Tax=Dovyalis caffra TaxID=77055 RepID=A0AAV1S0L2_9ROSI|nr:unnamed protein product [Dovyalis caffra]
MAKKVRGSQYSWIEVAPAPIIYPHKPSNSPSLETIAEEGRINLFSMAKKIRGFRSWIEVAPAPIIYPRKPSNSPRLETITEEGNEEHDEEDS